MAATQVFSTIELLEAILFELPAKDILLTQRVSKEWQAVVKESNKLQRALFFKPVPGAPTFIPRSSWREKPYSGKVIGNPLLQPLLDLLELGDDSHFTEEHNSVVAKLSKLGPKASAWTVPDASWRHMLTTQPPTRGVFSVYYCLEYSEDMEDEICEECSPNKIRMGEIVRDLDKRIKRLWNPDAYMAVSINGLRDDGFFEKLQSNYEIEEMFRSRKQVDMHQTRVGENSSSDESSQYGDETESEEGTDADDGSASEEEPYDELDYHADDDESDGNSGS